ncbi:MAG TPA: M20/M25/M40 family metallo-hydrolase [Nocardioides sp.]|uniref:M20 family metallopeptidase n=1 Tax=Nocardioides sp. TaxID=35761 RepID=UPI002D7F71F0|nr:M20/M25/M40 family metallo-hydrolase [Nocardioides sp.]HET6652542.1 M20/M25/M40 family metallo-hydrolase [Nocardioides sp.]
MSRATDLLTELVRADTVGAREGGLARRCAEILEKAGLDGRLVEWSAEGREQYVARTGGATPLTFTGHLDTVPATPADWTADPWAADVDGDRMVGRGTSDMKSGVAALVEAVADHAARAHDCRGVQVVLTAGEETGCTGALALPRETLALGGPLVVAEPTRNALVPGHKGAHWMHLTATGKAAHGSAPELGDNAAVKVARAAVALHDFDGWPEGVTANVGVLRGGVQTNVVPDAGEIYLDIRSVPSAQGDAIRDVVRSVVGDAVRVEDHVVLPPVDTDTSHAFVGLVGEALGAAGLDGAPVETARYFTDASALIPLLSDHATTPTVVLGPGEPEQCHVADEWCSLARVDEAVAVYGELLDRWCTGR